MTTVLRNSMIVYSSLWAEFIVKTGVMCRSKGIIHLFRIPMLSICFKDWFWGVHCSGVRCHYVFILSIPL